MPLLVKRLAVACLAAATVLFVGNFSFAQNNEQKPPEKQQPAEGKESPKKPDEFAEAEKVLGGAAGKPECVWLGRRVVNLLWRDDLDTAFRHLDLYDRFGCPSAHIQASFRCVVRQGALDPKATDALNSRVHDCWLDPSLELQGTAAVPSGTTNR